MTAKSLPAAPSPSPEGIFQLGWGFAASRALATAVEIDLFTQVGAGHRSAGALAKATKASERGVRMVADACVAFGLLTRDANGYGLSPEAALFLVRSSPAYLGEFVVFHVNEIAKSWESLTESVRTGRPVTAVDKPEEGIPFWQRLVDVLFPVGFPAAQLTGHELGRRHSKGPIRVLDVAAGSGVWGIGAALAEPRIQATAMDLAPTLERTREWARRMRVEDRVAYLAGDLRDVDFGRSRFEAAILGHICHSEGPVHAPRLLEKVARALVPGGTIVIAEFVPEADRNGPPGPLLFALNMLLLTSEGDAFALPQYRTWLEAAGFERVESLPAPAPSPLILATRRA